MLVSECFIMAFKALVANKVRSLLTMLGIIIGVGSVIAMVALGEGMKQSVTSSISSLGSNLLTISPAATNTGGVRGAAGSSQTLTYDDAKIIEQYVANINYIAPTVSTNVQLVNGSNNWNSSVQGTTPSYLNIRSLEVSTGTFISKNDMDKRNRVAVIGSTVAAELFGETNPVGKNLRLKNDPYTIIGVLKTKGESGFGQDQDDVVIIPLTTAQERLLGVTYVQSVIMEVNTPENMDGVEAQASKILRLRHNLRTDADDDFTIRSLNSLLELVEQQTTVITAVLGSIAAISLVVGGIGIMNIMLVSVTERTREIGIRKALGATYQNIMMQFLIESVVISVVGGLIGVMFGVGASESVNVVTANTDMTFKTALTPLPIIISFAFSVGIGLFFGIYPARKAAKLDPIEALRYE